jgi:single stranded DNA-binding protein
MFADAGLALQPHQGFPYAPVGAAVPRAGRRRIAVRSQATKPRKDTITMNLNNYICTGRLTRDPELRELANGTSVCELRVAVDGMARGRETGYINVSVFGPAGTAAATHLAKGWLVAVDGRLEYAQWDGKDGRRHDYTVIGNVEFLAAPRNSEVAAE